MERIEDQLAEANRQIAEGIEAIERLQGQIKRLQREGKDISKARSSLGRYHALQLKLLAEQEQLKKELAAVITR